MHTSGILETKGSRYDFVGNAFMRFVLKGNEIR